MAKKKKTESFGSSEAGKKGGNAAAKSLTKQQRSDRAKKAALSRWSKGGKDISKATHEGIVALGEAEISCYVLPNLTRLISTRGMMKGLGRVWRGRKYSGTELPVFLEAKNIKPFIHGDLLSVPLIINFQTPSGMLAEGIRAEHVPLVCETYLKARDAGVLKASQASVAAQADILMRGFAHVGIIALVDEATGFQNDRDRLALATILERFITKELRKWVKTFPLDFYKELCRLRDIPFSADMKLPQYFGHLTNNVIYSRLAPGVLSELKKKNPTDNGKRKNKHHQHLTADIGHPKLLQHLGSVVTLMKISNDWEKFMKILEEVHPPYKEMPLFPEINDD